MNFRNQPNYNILCVHFPKNNYSLLKIFAVRFALKSKLIYIFIWIWLLLIICSCNESNKIEEHLSTFGPGAYTATLHKLWLHELDPTEPEEIYIFNSDSSYSHIIKVIGDSSYETGTYKTFKDSIRLSSNLSFEQFFRKEYREIFTKAENMQGEELNHLIRVGSEKWDVKKSQTYHMSPMKNDIIIFTSNAGGFALRKVN